MDRRRNSMRGNGDPAAAMGRVKINQKATQRNGSELNSNRRKERQKRTAWSVSCLSPSGRTCHAQISELEPAMRLLKRGWTADAFTSTTNATKFPSVVRLLPLSAGRTRKLPRNCVAQELRGWLRAASWQRLAVHDRGLTSLGSTGKPFVHLVDLAESTRDSIHFGQLIQRPALFAGSDTPPRSWRSIPAPP
ncbi:hypothetical protein BCR34DRAFT_280882 [Clohesyomyces aquaticus]|uniref:Uncharacterized protein n=1 Tax=Clohesyomyces aquaticus TaxID=1231657 RepID=A0A1Y1ZRP3_9PLEO|nr:hypothetical protein BCR34DRAFT_280882 [Clohesyomyces aquaticus]